MVSVNDDLSHFYPLPLQFITKRIIVAKIEPQKAREGYMSEVIDYTGENGYRGVLYGKSSMAIYDKNGVERLHTGARGINTLEELKEFVEGVEEFLEGLEER